MSEKNLRVDVADTTTTYVGEASPKVSEASAFWKIKKISTSGNITSITWADGNDEFDNVWDNRVSLTYI